MFPEQAVILKNKPTDRDAINHIIAYFFQPEMERLGPLIYGALSVTIDSATVSLVLPTKIVTAYDSTKHKTLMKNGTPVAASFLLSFGQATYESYPNDNLQILPGQSFNPCAQEFAIGKKGAWMRPLDFHFDFQYRRANTYYAAFDPFDYPFHYKQQETKISHLPGDISTDDYINNFMGVVIKSGELHLPGISAPVIASDILLDGIEMNGHIRVAKPQMSFTKEELEKALTGAGFRIMPAESEDPEEIVLYFNYK